MESNPNRDVNQPDSTSTPTPVVNQENKPIKSHKVLFLLLGVLIVLVLVGGIGGGYYFGRSSITKELNPSSPVIPPKDPDLFKGSPTPKAIKNETADWKTYPIKTPYVIKSEIVSPNGKYKINTNVDNPMDPIVLLDIKGNIIVEDVIGLNLNEIGAGKKFRCQCGYKPVGWHSEDNFILKISNAFGEEYEYLVSAQNGKLDEKSLQRVK